MRKVSLFIGLALFALAGSARAQDEAPPPAAEPVAGAPAGDTAAAPAPAPAPEAAAAPAAAPAAAAKLTVGVDGAFQLPLGNMADVTGMGFGGLVRGEYNVIPNLNVTLRAGYIYSLKKSQTESLFGETVTAKSSINNIPIWVGGKYFITDMIFGAVELGLNMLSSKVEVSGGGQSGSISSSDNKFGTTVGAGVLLSGLEIKAQLVILDLGHAGDSMAVMANVGYDFLKM